MMRESFLSVTGPAVTASKKKSLARKARDRRLGSACIEVLEQRFLLSGAVSVTGLPEANAINGLAAITSGEASPSLGTFTDFGPTAPGITLTRTYTITNSGNSTLDLNATPVSLTGNADFTIVSQPGTLTLAPDASTTFELQFTTSNTTTENATVSIGSDDPATPFTFEVQAESLATITQSNVGIDTTGTGTGNVTANGQVLVLNYTGYLLDGSEFDSSAHEGGPFQFTLGAGQVIAGWDEGLSGLKVGQSRTLFIPGSQAYPSGQGIIPAGAELIFTTTLLDVFSITGKGNNIASAETTPSSSDGTNFGTSLSTPTTETFTISDVAGNLTSELSSPQVSITGATSFTASSMTAVNSTTDTFTVTYTPTTGTSTATVTVNTTNGLIGTSPDFEIEASGNPTVATIAVIGDNPGISTAITANETSPSQTTFTDFGPTATGGTSLTREYTITNNGNATLDITGVTMTGADANLFTVPGQPAVTVAPGGGTTQFTVQFAPNGTAATDTATVNIATNASGSPFSFEIQGEAVTMSGSTGSLQKATTGGTGTSTVAVGDLVMVTYTGYLTNGTEFTNITTPAQLVDGQLQVVSGLDTGLQGAKVNEQVTLIVPPSLGYGTSGSTSPNVPANSTLIYTATIDNIVTLTGPGGVAIPFAETSPGANNGTDFGTFSVITSPSKTNTFTLTSANGNLNTILAGSATSISAGSFTASGVTLSGGTGTFTVKYSPSVNTTDATVTILTASGQNNPTFEVQAEGPQTANVPQLGVKGDNSAIVTSITTGEAAPSQSTFTDFGPTAVSSSTTANNVPVTREYTITNNGNATLELSGSPLISISGADASDFTITSQPDTVINAGQTTTFTVQFLPGATGTRTATVSIASNDPNGPFTFEIQGEGETTAVSTDGLQTVTTTAGSGLAAQDGELVSITYTGYLTNGTVFESSTTNVSSSQFILGDSATGVVQGWNEGILGMKLGEQRTIIVPSTLGFGSAGSTSPSVPANSELIYTVTLNNIIYMSGKVGSTGVLIPNGESSFSANNGTNFGSVTSLPAGAITETYTITDMEGSVSSFLGAGEPTVAGSSAFQVSNYTINANNATFTVTYTPTAGLSAATVTLHNTQAGLPNMNFGVYGQGPAAASSTTGAELTLIGDNKFASIPIGNDSTATNAQQLWTNFGDSPVGGSVPVTREYTITNSGNATLDLLSSPAVQVTGAGAAYFTVTSQPSSTIAPGQTATFTIQFSPTVAGDCGATVTIRSNDPSTPFTFQIDGTGVQTVTTSDSLQTVTTTPGFGAGAQNGEILIMEYSGYLTDGTEFDSSLFPNRSPFQFVLGANTVIQGWEEGLVGMKVNESRTLIIPSSLGYGSQGQGSIPGGATLIFTTTLLDIISVSGVVNSSDVYIPNGENSPSALNATNFGTLTSNEAPVTETYQITGAGGDLSLILDNNNPVSLSGAGASAFTISAVTFNATDTVGTFTVTYPASTGTSNATVSVNTEATLGINPQTGLVDPHGQQNPNTNFAIEGMGPASDDGSVSEADMDWISGYAYNPTNLNELLTVEVVISGGPETPQIVVADQQNTTAGSLTGSAYHGFQYATPMLSQGDHTAFIYSLDSVTGAKTLIGTDTLVSQNSLFDEHYYLQQNPDVAAAVAAGTIATGYDHYIQYGQFEGRSPSPYWNESYYLAMNPDVNAAVAAGKISSGFMQFYLYGQYENRPGVPYFNEDFYLQSNPDVAAANAAGTISPFAHYVLFGQYEGRSPIPYFFQTYYVSNNPLVVDNSSGDPYTSVYDQFVEQGQFEGLQASPFYNEQTYLADNPDVAAAVTAGKFPDGFVHFLEYGQYEGRKA